MIHQSSVCPPHDIIAIVPAAGIGRRMQISLPKQYLTIGNKTLLELAIGALLKQPCICEVIVAISTSDQWYHKLPIAADSRVHVIIGGDERSDSVMAALSCTRPGSWVLVHDAVRACLHQDDLRRLLAITTRTEVGGILASPVRDTMKRARSGTNVIASTAKRDDLWHALTPQLFARDLLKNCLERARMDGILLTDESSALEYCGYAPLLVLGRWDNIKVTCPEDLVLARIFFSQLSKMDSA
ncbi:MAG: 2-C-methyl-D-erythritol 4-phosphate cytidylyltransferase [Sodalis sp. (in: enterobacteria)]